MSSHHGPGDESADDFQQQQPQQHHPQQQLNPYYNQYYNHPGQAHPQTNGAPYHHYDPRPMNYNNYHHNNQQPHYPPQWGPPRPYFNSQEYPQPNQHLPAQHHQPIHPPQQQFYPSPDTQRSAWPSTTAERHPPAPLDSLQMLVKENGVGGDKRPRSSDEPADTEGRKRRRKSDRPTRISNGAAPAADAAPEPSVAAPEPPPPVTAPAAVAPAPEAEPALAERLSPAMESPPAPKAAAARSPASAKNESPAVNGGGKATPEVTSSAEPKPENRVVDLVQETIDKVSEAPAESLTPKKEEQPQPSTATAATPESQQTTPVVTPKKKGRPKGSKNVKKREKKEKQPKIVYDDSDDEKKKKKRGRKKKEEGGKPAEAAPAEEKHPKGPYLKIMGDREIVINSGKTEEDSSKRPKSIIIDNELRTKVAGIGFSSAMAQHYDAFTTDETWVCAFCKRGSHQNGLGDLFGPYFVQTAKKKKKFEVWVHEECCVWAPGVGLVGQRLVGLQEAIFAAAEEECESCNKKGAMIGCVKRGCNRKVHFPCTESWHLDEENFISCCPDHERVPPEQRRPLKK